VKLVDVVAGAVELAAAWQAELGGKVFKAKGSVPGNQSLLNYTGKGRHRGAVGEKTFKHVATLQMAATDDSDAWNRDFCVFHTQQMNQGADETHQSSVRPAPPRESLPPPR